MPHEVVVVEMGETPHAAALAREHADRHVFVPTSEPLSLARARNRGVPFARADIVFWLDGDLLVTEDFLDKAIGELESRHLDALIPWTSIRSLSEADSTAVMAGMRQAADCGAVTTVLSRRDVCAGAIMARRDFVARYGGFWEGFHGSGTEGSAWLHKAQVLGHAAMTGRQDQHLYRLFHPDGGCHGSRAQIADRGYQRDLALLRRIRMIRNPRRFLQLYPPPSHFPAPLDGSQRIAFTGESERGGPPAVGIGALPTPVTAESAKSEKEDRLDLRGDMESVVFGATDQSQQRFELALALFGSQLGAMMTVLDCSTDSVDLGKRIARLHPHVTYHRADPFTGGVFHPPLDMPDGTVDRLLCLGLLDRLDTRERRILLDAAATALKPGGLLIASCHAGSPADDELVASARPFGLELVEETVVEVGGVDAGAAPQCVGKIFRRAGGPPAIVAPTVVFGLICPGRRFASSLAAVKREASMLGRLGYAASVVVGDGGEDVAIDVGGPAGPASAVPVRYLRGARPGLSRSRNRVIDAALDAGAEFILLVDSSILLPPLASYGMLCHMTGVGGRVGWLAPAACCFIREDAVPSNTPLGIPAEAVEPCSLLESARLALFRAAVFCEGVRFDESEVLNGLEATAAVDLSCQLWSRGYDGRRFGGIAIGHDRNGEPGGNAGQVGAAEHAYLLRKWRHDPQILKTLQHDLTAARRP
jgi:glycosyltransferase involved in cell wall biosynthesis